MYTGPDQQQNVGNTTSEPEPAPVAPYQPVMESTPSPRPLPSPVAVTATGAVGGFAANRETWLMWVGLTAAGAAAAAIVNYGVSYVVREPVVWSYISGIIIGALIGLGEWFVLRRFFPTMPVWVWPVASAAGILFGRAAYQLLPVAQAGFAGVVGCLTAATIFMIALPLNAVARRLENKRILGLIAAFVIGMLSLGLERVISPQIEEGISGNQGLYGVAVLIGQTQILAALLGIGQWLALRFYMPDVKWWHWMLAAAAGGTLAGLFRGLFEMILGLETLFRLGLLAAIISVTVQYALISAATGLVLVRNLPARQPLTPQSAPAPLA